MQPLNPKTTRSTAADLRRAGSALLITLAFVLLLSVLIVGFMSRVLLAHRISVSSAGQVKADVFAQGVSAQLIGDIEQEIQNNSISTVTSTGSMTWGTSGTNTWTANVYIPKLPQYMVPAYDYPGAPASGSAPASTIVNLLKVSTTAPVTDSSGTVDFPAAATGALTTAAALNGRAVSLNRWAETEMVDPTVYAAGATTPTWIPSWVVVKRDGTTATTWNNNLTYSHAGTGSVTTTVIGRYAYAIYDEGGLLDANVAGKPFTGAASTSTPYPYPGVTSYPVGENFADLTQLSTAATGTLFSQAQVDTLIGWRNNASINPTGAYPFTTSLNSPTGTATTYTFTPVNLQAQNVTNYFNYVTTLNTGNLTTGTTVVKNGTDYATDSAFTSRQQLIGFMQQLLGPVNGPAAMQYLTHFSRTLNQPSYLPPINDPMFVGTGPNVVDTGTVVGSGTYTAVTTALANPLTNEDSSTNTAQGKDADINAPFLGVRITAATGTLGTGTFTRNDGSLAVIGEPLVKKRFDLNRLAWVTYNGPIVSASTGTWSVPSTYIQALENTYGFTDAFLKQGTAANVYNYFGLSWIPDARVGNPPGDGQMKWIYGHSDITGPYTNYLTLNNENVNGVTFRGVANYVYGPSIIALQRVQGREADFFELLKAGIIAGSKGKAATWQKNYPVDDPSAIQNGLDISLNNAIIQLGANIIDQFSLDGFPQRILYSDGNTVGGHGNVFREFEGVENLPYFYRIRAVPVVGRLPSPIATTPTVTLSGTGTAATFSSSTPGLITDGGGPEPSVVIANTGSILDTGYCVFMEVPEIWNPFDPNNPRCALDSTGTALLADSNGIPLCPTSFRLVVDSTDPDDVVPPGYVPSSVSASNAVTAGFTPYPGVSYGLVQASEFWNPPSVSSLSGKSLFGTCYITSTITNSDGSTSTQTGAAHVYFGTGTAVPTLATQSFGPGYVSSVANSGPCFIDTGTNSFSRYPAGYTAPFTAYSANITSGTVTTSYSNSALEMSAPPFPHYPENSGIYFYINENSTANAANFFREPTMLSNYNTPVGSLVQPYGMDNLLVPSTGTTGIPNNHAPLSASSSGVLGTNLSYNAGPIAGSSPASIPYGCIRDIAGYPWTGIYLGTIPCAFYATTNIPLSAWTTATGTGGLHLLINNIAVVTGTGASTSTTTYNYPSVQGSGTIVVPWGVSYPNNWAVNGTQGGTSNGALTIRIQYFTGTTASIPPTNGAATGTSWATYDTKYANVLETHDATFNFSTYSSNQSTWNSQWENYYNTAYDPRTGRFGMPYGGSTVGNVKDVIPSPPGSPMITGTITPPNTYGWIDFANSRSLVSERPDQSMGYAMEFFQKGNFYSPTVYTLNMPGYGGLSSQNFAAAEPPDWSLGYNNTGTNAPVPRSFVPFGMFAQNSPSPLAVPTESVTLTPTGTVTPTPFTGSNVLTFTNSKGAIYYSDPDHIVRRGSASYMQPTSPIGQPLATAYTGALSAAGENQNLENRPIILNRPFRSVAELGYCFSGTPWKNIDFINPESGDSALLDIFSVGDTPDINGLIAGRVNLNTQQKPVIQALLAGSYKDEVNNYPYFFGANSLTAPSWVQPPITSTEAASIASVLTARTLGTNATGGQGPLRNLAELVGRYTGTLTTVAGDSTSVNYDGSLSFSGFSGDAGLTSAFAAHDSFSPYIDRLRASAVRALSAGGQTRTWNLLIDVVAQTGNYPSTATNFSQFAVQGEQRYWIHLAIDRYTGQVIDKQIEAIKE
jgi:hypothetical protein